MPEDFVVIAFQDVRSLPVPSRFPFLPLDRVSVCGKSLDHERHQAKLVRLEKTVLRKSKKRLKVHAENSVGVPFLVLVDRIVDPMTPTPENEAKMGRFRVPAAQFVDQGEDIRR